MFRAPDRSLTRQLWVLLALSGTATALFRATGLDLAVERLFLTPCCSWPMAELPFWHFVYVWGVFGGLLLAASALVTLTLSYWYPARLFRWRRPALFLVIVLAVGPGLVVNGLFKDHFGRPRPREVVELGGHERFLEVWTPGNDSQAKSFPCGHCSMGFYIATPFFVFRRRRPRLALAFAGSGLLFGFVLGVARMMAGGHFLSDVLFSGGMVWLVALAVHHVMDLDREPVHPPSRDPKKDRTRARVATALGAILLSLFTTLILLATPYVSERTFTRTASELRASSSSSLEVSLDEATVTLAAGDEFSARYDIHAFGFPTSRVEFRYEQRPERASLEIERMGWFTERRTHVDLRLPRALGKPVFLRLDKGRVDIDTRGFSSGSPVEVFVKDGEVHLTGPGPLGRDGVVVHVEHGAVVRD